MAPLPENNTPCVWLDYSDGVNEHSLMFRYAGSGPAVADVLDAMVDFIDAFDAGMYTITILGARARASASTVTLPVPYTGPATFGTGTMPLNRAPVETRFLGRSPGGRKVSWSLYGCNAAIPDNFRFPASPGSGVLAAIDALIAAQALDIALAIDYGVPVMYPYADVNYNSYWEGERRG